MRAWILAGLLAASACQPPARETPGGTTPDAEPPRVERPAAVSAERVQRLEAEARALADTAGCTRAEACRTAPVGERACGGPRDYLVYCAATTDTAALFAKLQELREAEAALNRATDAVSTCEFRAPPGTELRGGSCRAVTGAEPILR